MAWLNEVVACVESWRETMQPPKNEYSRARARKDKDGSLQSGAQKLDASATAAEEVAPMKKDYEQMKVFHDTKASRVRTRVPRS